MNKTYKRKSGKRGPVRAKKVVYDGVTFASGLEKYMYIALRKDKIKFELLLINHNYDNYLVYLLTQNH